MNKHYLEALIKSKKEIAYHNFLAEKEKIDFGHEQRMRDYHNKLAALEREKQQFIKDNPYLPKETIDLMFLNVNAPPQKINIIIE